MSRSALLALVVALVACGGDAGPTGPVARVDGQVATFDGLELTVFQIDDGWDGGSADPAPGNRFVTVQILYRNRSDRAREVDHRHFEIEADGGLRRPSTVPLRSPVLIRASLAPGEILTRWLTFVLPLENDPARLVWTPENPFPDVDATLLIDLP